MTDNTAPFRVRWVVLGLLIIELGWILAVPPFGGIDEWDHAYRASAVAHGQWVAAPSEATRGTGAVVRAEPDIVDAARPECERLLYTGDAECVGSTRGDRVWIASGAGRYHPLFYAVVGSPTLALDGVASLYAMRLVAMLLCLAMLGMTFRTLLEWKDPMVAVVVLCGLTPMVLYTATVVSPNGLEMASGLALWAALGAIARHDRPIATRHVALAVAATSLLLTLRSLGPVWALLILATALIAWPTLVRCLWSLMRSKRGVISALVVGAVAAGSVTWILIQDSLVIGRNANLEGLGLQGKLRYTIPQIPLWIAQSIGAFPYRSEEAPPVVYAGFMLVLGSLLVFALWRGNSRVRVAVLVVLGASLVIPLLITVATLDQFSTAWQGRYGLPYLLGLSLLAGSVVAERFGPGMRRAFLVGAFPVLAVCHSAAVVDVLSRERRKSPQFDTGAWSLAPPTAVLTIIVVCGVALTLLPLMKKANGWLS